MFVTEKKRAVYDETGAIYKIDILRSVRRKDAPQSMIKAIEEEQNEKSIAESQSSKFKKIVEFVLIGIIAVTFYFLICSLLAPLEAEQKSGLDITSTIWQEAQERSAEPLRSFSQFASMAMPKNEGTQDLKRLFLSGSQCRIVQGGIMRCQMSLEKLGLKNPK